MSILLKTPEGDFINITRGKNICLYLAPEGFPGYTRGTNLFMHISPSGRRYFYTYRWSLWAGEDPAIIELISEEEARDFLLKRAQWSGLEGLKPVEIELAKKIFPGSFEETT